MSDDIRERLSARLTRAMRNAGFLDAYLNIRGVKDDAEALAMLRSDLADFLVELSHDGLTITETETARVGAAVLRLPDDYRWTIDYIPTRLNLRDEQRYEVTRSDGDIFTGVTLPEAVEEALR